MKVTNQMTTKTVGKWLTCRHCQDQFQTTEEYNNHEKSHSGGKGYQCLLCDQSFEAEFKLSWHHKTRHRKSQSNGTPQRGDQQAAKSSEVTPDPAAVRNGVKPASRRSLPTSSKIKNGNELGESCVKTENGNEAIVSNGSSVDNEGEPELKFKMIKKEPAALVEKKGIRSDKCFICRHCGDTLFSVEEHQSHEKSHLGGKGFKCLLCQQSFETEVTLAWHKRTRHRNEPLGAILQPDPPLPIKEEKAEEPEEKEESEEKEEPEEKEKESEEMEEEPEDEEEELEEKVEEQEEMEVEPEEEEEELEDEIIPDLVPVEPEPEAFPPPSPLPPPQQNGQDQGIEEEEEEEPPPPPSPPTPPAKLKRATPVKGKRRSSTVAVVPVEYTPEQPRKSGRRRDSTRSTSSVERTMVKVNLCNFTCSYCGDRFINQQSHQTHEDSHMGGKGYKCLLCEQSFEAEAAFALHRRMRHRNQTVKEEQPESPKTSLPEEEMEIDLPESLNNGQDQEEVPPTPPPIPPPRSSSSSTKKRKLKLKKVEVKEPVSNFNDTVEQKVSVKPEGSRSAATTEVGNFICGLCGDRFHNPVTHEIHEESHVGGKGFKCLICEQSFESEVKLAWHHRIRHRERNQGTNKPKHPSKEDKQVKKKLKMPAPAGPETTLINRSGVAPTVPRPIRAKRKKMFGKSRRIGPKIKNTSIIGQQVPQKLKPPPQISAPIVQMKMKVKSEPGKTPADIRNESDNFMNTYEPKMAAVSMPVPALGVSPPTDAPPRKPKMKVGRYMKSNGHFKCQLCPQRNFRSKYDLSVHLLRMHTTDEEKPYRCSVPKCGKGFVTRFELTRHIGPCRKNFSSGIPKRTPPQKKLIRQEDGSLFEVPQPPPLNKVDDTQMAKSPLKNGRFACRYCGDTFPLSGSHLLHEESHVGGKGFQCLICDQSFEKEVTLVWHRRTRHRSQQTTDNGAEEEGEKEMEIVTPAPPLALETIISTMPIPAPIPTVHMDFSINPDVQGSAQVEPSAVTASVSSVKKLSKKFKSRSPSTSFVPGKPVAEVAAPSFSVPSLEPGTPQPPQVKSVRSGGGKEKNLPTGPYSCPQCPNGYPTELAVRKHILRVHTSPDKKPYHCPLPDCGRAYATRAEYNRHVKISRCAPQIKLMESVPSLPRLGKKKRKEPPAGSSPAMAPTIVTFEYEQDEDPGLHICTQCPYTRLFHTESELNEHLQEIHEMGVITLKEDVDGDPLGSTPSLEMVIPQPRLVLNSFMDDDDNSNEAGTSSNVSEQNMTTLQPVHILK